MGSVPRRLKGGGGLEGYKEARPGVGGLWGCRRGVQDRPPRLGSEETAAPSPRPAERQIGGSVGRWGRGRWGAGQQLGGPPRNHRLGVPWGSSYLSARWWSGIRIRSPIPWARSPLPSLEARKPPFLGGGALVNAPADLFFQRLAQPPPQIREASLGRWAAQARAGGVGWAMGGSSAEIS